jgi:hypothetical protein
MIPDFWKGRSRTPRIRCCRKRERSERSGSRSLSPGPRPLRTARASFPACRSSRLTCSDAGRSEDPKAQALDSPCRWGPIWDQSMQREPRPFGAGGGPTVRTVSAIAFPSSRPTRPVGRQHPFRLGLSTYRRLYRLDLQLDTRPRGGKQHKNGQLSVGKMLLVSQMLICCNQQCVALLFGCAGTNRQDVEG